MSNNNKSKSKSKTNQHDQEQVGNDMWQNLLNFPLPTQPPTQPPPMGFARFAPIANPYSMSPDDPRRNYQHQGWYQNPRFTPPMDWSPNTYHGTTSSNPLGYQQTPSGHSQHTPTQNFVVPETQHQHLLESSDEAEPEPEPETESEPEAEPEPVRKKGKKPKKKNDAPRRVQVRWSDDEARILAERWIHCSENGVIGNNQSNESFWRNVHSGYNSLVPTKRNLNQLTGKWNKISHDVKTFESIHKKFRESCHQSGAGDKDVLDAAKQGFYGQLQRKFIYESCWDVLKHFPKFFTEQGVMSNKRPFQPEPDATDLGGNDNPMTSTLEANMRTLFRDDPIRRPPGRKTSRNSQSSDAGSSSRSSVASEKLEAIEAVKAQALKATETLETIKKNNIKKRRLKL